MQILYILVQLDVLGAQLQITFLLFFYTMPPQEIGKQ